MAQHQRSSFVHALALCLLVALHAATAVAANRAELGFQRGALVRDQDGHALALVEP